MTRHCRRLATLGLALGAACASPGATPTPVPPPVRQADVERMLSALADDSMAGRRTH